jgi:peroxiredoxin
VTSPQSEEQAPDFTLKDQNNQDVTLSEFRGQKPVLLVFYPLAFSGICSTELCSLRDDLPQLADAAGDIAVLTVSVDSVFAHRTWADQQNFQFSLLSDFWPHGEVARRYGVFDEHKGIARRGTFAIDTTGTVRWQAVNEIGDRREVALYSEALAAVA